MEWTEMNKLANHQFQRMVGVKRATFDKMLEIIYHHGRFKANNGGAKPYQRGKPVADHVDVLPEYRTFFHIAGTYGISEAQCWRIVRKWKRFCSGAPVPPAGQETAYRG